ncbi:hypothetical protein LO762_11510 [Actinocorallia sp. API 0066]|uniref:hypothetical protein n=1 Tax=Actinocorallia sp. API 0066 TaxID=2896846 RepID=UPI001E52ED08|nr:hypothetical protein [Actinocorallia sp. API 0066]MCD0449811.1 hypothetical protein [Actinocorallia sp. API 0066]
MPRRGRALRQALVDELEADRRGRATAARMDAAFGWWVVVYSGHRGTYTAFPRHGVPPWGGEPPEVEEERDPAVLAARMRGVDERLCPRDPVAAWSGDSPHLARQAPAAVRP